MPTLIRRVAIGVPAERVFARLAELERGPEWMPYLISVERTTPPDAAPVAPVERGPGPETALVARFGGRERRGSGRVVAWEPPRRLVLRWTLEDGITSTTTFELTDQGTRTRLTARLDYSLPPSSRGGFAGGVLAERAVQGGLREALANLKGQLEATPAGAPTPPS
jgi:uncharacterized protein YndB with AHSA1/START domain